MPDKINKNKNPISMHFDEKNNDIDIRNSLDTRKIEITLADINRLKKIHLNKIKSKNSQIKIVKTIYGEPPTTQ